MLNELSPDSIWLSGSNQTANCPIPDIFPASPHDYRALLCYPNDLEFSVNGCYVRIWNAAGCLGSVDNQRFGGFYVIKRHLPR